MKIEKIETAEAECNRFLKAAAKAKRRLKAEGREQFGNMCGLTETAACRRASLDLTRALAELRKP